MRRRESDRESVEPIRRSCCLCVADASAVVPITYAIAAYLVKLDQDRYTITDNLFYKSYKGAAILKGRNDLLKALTGAFQSVIASPDYSEAISRWGLQKLRADKAYVNVPGEPLSKTIR